MADQDAAGGARAGETGPGDLPADANCYLACFPARPIRLHRERATTIGRADGNTIVLADSDVSRKHAVIEWGDGRFVVRDVGSRNGVYVNDVRVDEAPLAPDDRVRVGGRVFSFIVGDDQAMRRLFLRKRQEKHTGATEVFDAQSFARPSAGFAGSLRDFGLAELLQALELGRKTGKVTVDCDQGRGEMLIREGQVVRASLGEVRNEQAVYRLVELDNGRFEFENRPVDEEPEISVKTASLLMESFRLIDEAQREPAASPAQAFGATGGERESTIEADCVDGSPPEARPATPDGHQVFGADGQVPDAAKDDGDDTRPD